MSAKLGVKFNQILWVMIRLFISHWERERNLGCISHLQHIKNNVILPGPDAAQCDNSARLFCSLLRRAFPEESVCNCWAPEQDKLNQRIWDQNRSLISSLSVYAYNYIAVKGGKGRKHSVSNHTWSKLHISEVRSPGTAIQAPHLWH